MNIIYIATSVDGFIAGKNEDMVWLNCVENPNQEDHGFSEFVDSVDALLMGRITFEMVLSFGVAWPYSKPVFVLSSTLVNVPEELKGKVEIVNGSVKDVIKKLNGEGLLNLYIDGGKVIQSCLKEGIIDELMIYQMSILLGGGTPLFGDLSEPLNLELVETETYLSAIVKTHYRVKK